MVPIPLQNGVKNPFNLWLPRCVDRFVPRQLRNSTEDPGTLSKPAQLLEAAILLQHKVLKVLQVLILIRRLIYPFQDLSLRLSCVKL